MLPSEWLVTFDAWSIVDESRLDTLDEQYRSHVPTHTYEEAVSDVAASKAGGHVSETKSRVFYGFSAASHLAYALTGKSSDKMGRGFSFRENCSILKEAGY